MNEINKKNINKLMGGFKRYVNIYYKREPGFPNSSCYFHNKVIGMIRKEVRRNKSYTALFRDMLFLEMVYATVALWGMDRMTKNPRMVEFKDFKESVEENLSLLNKLSKYKLNNLKRKDVDDIKTDLGKLFDGLRVMEGEKKLIGVSKAMHHLLPDLVPPIDGNYTLRFFYGKRKNISAPNIKRKNEEKKFIEIFNQFIIICENFEFKKNYLKRDWDTSVPKLIDNAIIGFIDKEYKKKKHK